MSDRTKTLTVGAHAPDFTLKAHQGEPVQLAKLRDKHVVLVFYPLAWTPV